MGSLDIVDMPLQLCSKFNSGNCKLVPITNHFCEVPFTKTIILFLKTTFSSLHEWMVFTDTFSKTKDVILITNISMLCVSLANFYHWEYIVPCTLFWVEIKLVKRVNLSLDL